MSPGSRVLLGKTAVHVKTEDPAKAEASGTAVAVTEAHAKQNLLITSSRKRQCLMQELMERRQNRASALKSSAHHATVAIVKDVKTGRIDSQGKVRSSHVSQDRHGKADRPDSLVVKADRKASSRRAMAHRSSPDVSGHADRTVGRNQTNLNHLHQMRKIMLMLAVTGTFLLSACDPSRVYEQNVELPDKNWTVDNAPVFEFAIEDTTKRYNVYFNVRYSLAYDYYNLYLQHRLTAPDSSLVSSSLHELHLMDAKTGKPEGKGSSDIYDMQSLALEGVTFPQVGTYRLQLTQYMRRDPLPNILAVGVRVEEAAD